MGEGSKKRAAARSRGSDDDETVDADTIQQQKQVEDLQLEVLRLKKRQKLLTKVRSRSRAKGGKKSAMSREVQKIAKADLWSLKKFICDDPGLCKATKWVLGRLGDLVEMDGMSAQDRADAEEEWIVKHSDDVRTGLNTQRNYTMSELRSLVLEFYDQNKEAELPTEKQMCDIVMRKGFTGTRKATMEGKLDVYWDKIFGKIAGNTLWSNGKKYYQLLSFGTCPSRIDGVDDVPCGHHSTEAMVCGVYENYLVRWKYEAIQKRNGKKVDIEHEDYKTKGYVNAICGRKEYGGWTTAGKKRIHELGIEIKENRKKNEAEIRAIEEACLARLRYTWFCFCVVTFVLVSLSHPFDCFAFFFGSSTLHNRAEIDAKKKAPRAKKGAAYDTEPEDSDDEQWGF